MNAKNITTIILTGSFAASCLQAEEAAIPPPVEHRHLAPVMVTGILWETEIGDATDSITVLETEAAAVAGNLHFEDLLSSVPNLTGTGGTSRIRHFQMRGVGENSQFEGETPDSSVRFLIDDLDFTGLGSVGGLFDVRQVEVLRGPQAGAFGANAAGGVIRLVTQEPTNFWTGNIEAGLATHNTFNGGIAVGGPLLEEDPEKLTMRLAVSQYRSDGFIKNRFLNRRDTQNFEEFMVRLRLRWLSSPDWQWDGSLLVADQDNGYDAFSLDNTGFTTISDEPGRDKQFSLGGSLRGTYSGLDDMRFTTITSVVSTDSVYSFDADWTSAGDPRTYNGFMETDRERRVGSQELRLESAPHSLVSSFIDRWTVGLYGNLLREDTDVRYRDDFGPFAISSRYETETFAAYGQSGHSLTPETLLTLSIRGEHHTVTVKDDSGETVRQRSPLVGGKVTLEHYLSPIRSLYGTVARGYKAGGANFATFTLPGDPLTYDPERLWNYEVGYRDSWADGRLDTRLSLFYLRRSATQVRDSAGTGGFFRFLTVNADVAHHYGLESESTWHFAQDWSLRGTLALLETRREAYDDPGGRVSARSLANAPSYAYSLQLAYRPADGFFSDVSVSGRDGFYESNRGSEQRDAFTVVNASAGYRWDGWTVSLWVRNLFDERYANRVFLFANEGPDFADIKRYESLAAPRTAGVQAQYAF